MLEFYMQKVLENRADNGLLSTYSENLLGYAAQLAQVIQAQAAVRQAEALEKLAGCIAPLTSGESAINTYDNSRFSHSQL